MKQTKNLAIITEIHLILVQLFIWFFFCSSLFIIIVFKRVIKFKFYRPINYERHKSQL